MSSDRFDLIVFGSGAAAASCWHTAVRMGKRVAVIESDVLGGECPTFACMPTKALLHCAEVFETVARAGEFGVSTGSVSLDYSKVKAWKDAVVSRTGAALGEKPYQDMGVTVIRGRARFVSPSEIEVNGRVYEADRYLVATGSSPVRPAIPGLPEAGHLTFREAIDLTDLPRSMLVLGGGPVGCEFTHLFSAFGTRVVLADRNPRLVHREDPEVGDFLADRFRHRGVDVRLKTAVTRVDRVPGGKQVALSPGRRAHRRRRDPGGHRQDPQHRPRPRRRRHRARQARDHRGRDAPDLECASLRRRRRRRPAPLHPRRLLPGPGGVREHVRLAPPPRGLPRHAPVRVHLAGGGGGGVDRAGGPRADTAVLVGRASMADNDRAITAGRRDGFVKVIADRDGRLLGGAIVAERGGEVAQELALAIALGATAAQLAGAVHAFPTYSEALVAACLAVEEGRDRGDAARSSR